MNKSNIKIVFFGTAEFAGPVLGALGKEYEVVAVVTAPDKPTGRKQILTPPPIKLTAESLKLKVLQPEKLRDNYELVKELGDLDLDIGIIAAYGKIIPPEIFNLPKHGIIVVHPSLLPKYRGPTPIQSAILNGDNESGVTIMKMDEEIDHGDIISTASYKMPNTATFKEINTDLWQMGAELLIKTLPDYLGGKIKSRPQDHSKATFTHKFTTEDGEIKPSDDVLTSYNKVRALNPEPGVFIWFDNNGKKLRLKILAAEIKNGHLEIKRVQLEGGKPMAIKEFIAGHPNFIGSLL